MVAWCCKWPNKYLTARFAANLISQFPLSARQLAGDARVVPARGVHRARERLEQRLYDVMRLVAVKQFEMQIAARFVRESLKKFFREAKTKCARSVLIFFNFGNFLLRKFVQSAPDKMWSSAKIHDATREAFVHRHISFSGERIFWIKSKPVTTNSLFVAERSHKCLSERDAAIFDGVVRIHFQIAFAF